MKMNKKFLNEIDEKASETIRIIDNASSIKYDNKYYIPVNPDTGEVACFMKKI